MHGLVKILIFLFLGVTATFLARYLLGAAIVGAVGYLGLRAVIPEGSVKGDSLKHLLGLLKAAFGGARHFGDLFLGDLRTYSIAALLTGIALGILIMAGRRRWFCS